MRLFEVSQFTGRKAGIVPYYLKDGVIYALLMRPSNPEWGGTMWQIAKGRVEDGEDTKEAAIREGQEELGLYTKDLVSHVFLVQQTHIDGNEEASKRPYEFYVYAAQLNGSTVSGTPHFETGDTAWITKDKLGLVRPDQKDILAKMFTMVEKQTMREAKFTRKSVDQELPFDSDYEEHGHKLRLQKEPWRGPHEGRTLTLMVRGLKPAALLDEYQTPKYLPYVENGKLSMEEFTFDWHGTPVKQYVVTQLGQEWRAKRIANMFMKREQYKSDLRLWHARLGMLLGYSNEDIRAFLNRSD